MEPIPSLFEFNELYKDNLLLKNQINQLKIENTQLINDKNEMKKSLEKARLIIIEQRKKIQSQAPIIDSNGNIVPSSSSTSINNEYNSSPQISSPLRNCNSLNNSLNNIKTNINNYSTPLKNKKPIVDNNSSYSNSNLESIINMDCFNDNSNNKESCDLDIEINNNKKSSPMVKSFSLPSINIPFFSFQSNKQQQQQQQEKDEIEYPIESINYNSECSTPNGSISSIGSKSNSSNSNNNNNSILLETIKNMLKKNKEKTKEQELLIRQLKQQNNNLIDSNNLYKDKINNLEIKLLNNTTTNIQTQIPLPLPTPAPITKINNNQNNSLTRSPSKLLDSIRLSPSICNSSNNSNNNNNNNNNKQKEVHLEVIVL